MCNPNQRAIPKKKKEYRDNFLVPKEYESKKRSDKLKLLTRRKQKCQ